MKRTLLLRSKNKTYKTNMTEDMPVTPVEPYTYPHHEGDVTAEQLAADIAAHPEAYPPILDHKMRANGIDVQRPVFESEAVEAAENAPVTHNWEQIAADAPISPAHEAEHQDLGRALDPGYDERTVSEKRAIGTIAEIGDMAEKLSDSPEDIEARIHNADQWVSEHADGFNVADLPPSCADEVISQVLYRPGAVANSIAADFAEHIEDAPQLRTDTIDELLKLTASDKNNVFNIALRFPEVATESGVLQSAFAHADKVSELLASRPDLMKAIKNNRRLSKGDFQPVEVFDKLETDEERTEFLHHIEVIESDTADSWLKDMSYAVIRLETIGKGFGEVRAGAINHDSSFRPEENDVTHLPIPFAAALSADARPPMKSFADMSAEEREMVIAPGFGEQHANDMDSVSNISLPDLKPEFQELVVGAVLANAAEASTNPGRQSETTARNAEIARRGNYLVEGDLVHTSSADSLQDVLSTGLVCGELIGEASNNDAYPLNVDFNVIMRGELEADAFEDKALAITAGRHGTHPSANITYVLRRNETNKQQFPDRPAQTSQYDHKHRLIFGAVPSTEISSIVLAAGEDERTSLMNEAHVLETVLAQNTYYPVVSAHGELLLTPEEFTEKHSSRLEELRGQGIIPAKQGSELANSAEQQYDIPLSFLPPPMPGFSF